MRVFRLLFATDELAPGYSVPWLVIPRKGETRASARVPVDEFVIGRVIDRRVAFNLIRATDFAETEVVFPFPDAVLAVRSHVRDRLEQVDPGAVQWLQAPFIGREHEEWWCANVLHSYPALDEGRSSLEWHKDEHGQPDRVRSPMGIYDAVLVASKIGPRALFRLDRYRWWLCCHESVYDACRSCGVTGLAFQELTVL